MTRPLRSPFDRKTIVPLLGAVAASLLALNFMVFVSHQTRRACVEPVHVAVAPPPPPAAPLRIEVERLDRELLRAEQRAARADRALQRAEEHVLRLNRDGVDGHRRRILIAR